MKGPFWPSARRTYLNPRARVECALPTRNQALCERSPLSGRLLAGAPRCWLPCANSSLSHSRSCSLASSPRLSSRLSIPVTIRRRRPAPPRPRETTTTDDTTTTPGDDAAEDISGPCDEAEHANDPRCTRADAPADDDGTPAQGGEDISGPCDEAEHANDPRCTGAGGDRVDKLQDPAVPVRDTATTTTTPSATTAVTTTAPATVATTTIPGTAATTTAPATAAVETTTDSGNGAPA